MSRSQILVQIAEIEEVYEAAEHQRTREGDTKKAIALYRKAQSLVWASQSSYAVKAPWVMKCYHMIGVCHKMDRHYRDALDLLGAAFRAAEALKDKRAQANILRDRAACRAGLGNIGEALSVIEESIRLLADDKSDPAYWATIGYRGRIHLLEGRYSLASRDLGCADSELRKLGAKEMELYNMFHLAVLNMVVRQRKIALLWLSDADRLSEEYGSPDRALRHKKLRRLCHWYVPKWYVMMYYRQQIGA
jgi:tetratricopeptide (TPR) repeat protein